MSLSLEYPVYKILPQNISCKQKIRKWSHRGLFWLVLLVLMSQLHSRRSEIRGCSFIFRSLWSFYNNYINQHETVKIVLELSSNNFDCGQYMKNKDISCKWNCWFLQYSPISALSINASSHHHQLKNTLLWITIRIFRTYRDHFGYNFWSIWERHTLNFPSGTPEKVA